MLLRLILDSSDRPYPTVTAAEDRPWSIMWSVIQSLLSRVFCFARERYPRPFRRGVSPIEGPQSNVLPIVGLVIDEKDRRLLAGLGSRNRWCVSFADTLEAAQVLSTQLGAFAVLSDRDVPGREWREVVEALSQSRHRPCVLLISSVVDDYLWNEVARRGGYDVLTKPLREEEVLRCIKLAWVYWNSPARRRAQAASDGVIA